jgi:hypothetical protein
MRSLRWVGLVFSLLIVGVLGGLMAPLSSEAGTPPTIKFTADGASTTITITKQATCPFTGFICYKIPPGTYRGWNFTDIDSTNTAKLAVQDTNGLSGNLDQFRFDGVRISPGGSLTTTPHTAVLEIQIPTDAVPNNAGTLSQFALKGQGYFNATDSNHNELDEVKFELSAVFCTKSDTVCGGTGTQNKRVPVLNASNKLLKGTKVSSTDLRVRTPVNVAQVTTYPQMPYNGVPNSVYPGGNVTTQTTTFDWTTVKYLGVCNTGPLSGFTGDKCAPTITLTMTLTIYGSDNLELPGTFLWAGGTCDPTPATDPGFGHLPKGTSEVPCVSTTNAMNLVFANEDKTSGNPSPAIQCDATTETCPCDDPDACPGKITIEEIAEDGGAVGLTKATTFNFTGCGNGVDATGCPVAGDDLSFGITIPKKGTKGSKTFGPISAGVAGDVRSFTYIDPALLTNLVCSSDRGNSTFSTTVATATVANLGASDTVTCTFTTNVD